MPEAGTHCTARNAQVLTLHCSGCLAQQTGNETMSLRHSLHTSDVFWCVLETAGARNPEPCRGQSSRHGIRTAIRSRTSGRVSRRIRSSSLTDNNSHIQSQPPGGGRPRQSRCPIPYKSRRTESSSTGPLTTHSEPIIITTSRDYSARSIDKAAIPEATTKTPQRYNVKSPSHPVYNYSSTLTSASWAPG